MFFQLKMPESSQHLACLYVRTVDSRYILFVYKGLETNTENGSEKFGIWNGNEFIFSETSMSWLNTVKMIMRYGPLNLKRLNDIGTSGVKVFTSLYQKQEEGQTFR